LREAAVERELHRKAAIWPDEHVEAAWPMRLLAIEVNGVDCTEQQRGSRMMRLMRRPTGDALSVLGLTHVAMFLRTPGALYLAPTALVIKLRRSARSVDLVWLTPKRPNDQQRPGIPEGNLDLDRVNIFLAEMEALSAEDAHAIEARFIEVRDERLAEAQPQTRATMERVIRAAADAPLG
jgi:hypothetical protein